MILLKATNETLELASSSTSDLDYSVSWVDTTATTNSPSTTEGKITTATTTTILAAPAGSTVRKVKMISVRNVHASASNTISFKKDIAATEYKLTPEFILLSGEAVVYMDGIGWTYYGADGSIKNAAVAASANSTYRTVLDVTGSHTAARVAGTYGFGHGDALAISGTGTLYPLDVIYLKATDFPTVYGLTTKLRLKAQLYCNDVAPFTGTFVFGLHPVTRPATSGGAGLVIYTIGAAVAGSTVTFTNPTADSSNQGESSDFAMPADGHYIIGVVTSATMAASSHAHLSALLQMRNA